MLASPPCVHSLSRPSSAVGAPPRGVQDPCVPLTNQFNVSRRGACNWVENVASPPIVMGRPFPSLSFLLGVVSPGKFPPCRSVNAVFFTLGGWPPHLCRGPNCAAKWKLGPCPDYSIGPVCVKPARLSERKVFCAQPCVNVTKFALEGLCRALP